MNGVLIVPVNGQVATGGPGGLWKIYDGRCKKEGAPAALVSVWMLDKRPPASMRDSQQAEAWECLLELCRKCAALSSHISLLFCSVAGPSSASNFFSSFGG